MCNKVKSPIIYIFQLPDIHRITTSHPMNKRIKFLVRLTKAN